MQVAADSNTSKGAWRRVRRREGREEGEERGRGGDRLRLCHCPERPCHAPARTGAALAWGRTALAKEAGRRRRQVPERGTSPKRGEDGALHRVRKRRHAESASAGHGMCHCPETRVDSGGENGICQQDLTFISAFIQVSRSFSQVTQEAFFLGRKPAIERDPESVASNTGHRVFDVLLRHHPCLMRIVARDHPEYTLWKTNVHRPMPDITELQMPRQNQRQASPRHCFADLPRSVDSISEAISVLHFRPNVPNDVASAFPFCDTRPTTCQEEAKTVPFFHRWCFSGMTKRWSWHSLAIFLSVPAYGAKSCFFTTFVREIKRHSWIETISAHSDVVLVGRCSPSPNLHFVRRKRFFCSSLFGLFPCSS